MGGRQSEQKERTGDVEREREREREREGERERERERAEDELPGGWTRSGSENPDFARLVKFDRVARMTSYWAVRSALGAGHRLLYRVH